MPRRPSKRRTYHKFSPEEMRQIAFDVICNDNNLIFKKGDIDEIVARYRVSYEETPDATSKRSNELMPNEFGGQTSTSGLEEVMADTNVNDEQTSTTDLDEAMANTNVNDEQTSTTDLEEAMANSNVNDEQTSTTDLDEAMANTNVNDEQTSTTDLEEAMANINVKDEKADISESLEGLASVKEDQNIEAMIAAVKKMTGLTIPHGFFQESDGQYQTQPEDLSFRNFIGKSVSVDLHHFDSSTNRTSAVDTDPSLRNRRMPSDEPGSNISSPSNEGALMPWGSQFPIGSSSDETQVQDEFHRPWYTSVTPGYINEAGTTYDTSGLQMPAGYSNVWGLPSPMDCGVGFDNPYASEMQSKAGYINPGLEYGSKICNNQFHNVYGNRQEHQMIRSQPLPYWELQKPKGFSRMRAQTTNRSITSNEESGPSNSTPPLRDDQKLEHFMFALGMVPTNPSDTMSKRYHLVDSAQNHITRSGQAYGTQESVKKLVVHDDPVPGETSSITRGPIYRCQMCDTKIDPDVCKTADLRYCPDCYYYVYCWKRD